MKNLQRTIVLYISFIFSAFVCSGQNSIITTYTSGLACPQPMVFDTLGNLFVGLVCSEGVIKKVSPSGVVSTFAGIDGTAGFSGDGGPASAAKLNGPNGLLIDDTGNIIFLDANNYRIRKINTLGIISTIAGNGTMGYTGDGGPATACTMYGPKSIARDAMGNIFYVDARCTVRKINAAGIITTVAGINGVPGYSGDGGPATAAHLMAPTGITTDINGNIFVVDGSNNRIRKINVAGIITTVAGNGTAGFMGDGGSATAAEIYNVSDIKIDRRGNIYFADMFNYRIRKINSAGIISTVAGNGTTGYSGDGGNPLLASFSPIVGLAIDKNDNLYMADATGSAIRKVTTRPDISADSFSVYINRICDHVELDVSAKSTSVLTVKTSFGDQSTDISTMSVYGAYKNLHLPHYYPGPGTYTIKMVLFRGTTAIDSVKFTHTSLLCSTMPVKFFYDANNNCRKDSAEDYIYLPTTAEVDSNGVAIDTISSTSGFYYTAYGNPGDIYTFRILSVPPGLHVTCPLTASVTDTLQLTQNIDNTRYIAMGCNSSTGFDLAENVSLISGRHMANGTVIVNNAYCHAVSSVLTLNISPKYAFGSASPSPSSVVGNTITWNLGAVSLTARQPVINFTLQLPSPAWLIPGDTIHSGYTVTPIAADLDTMNNHCTRTDTVKSSFDPNDMFVSPSGFIVPGTQLTYTIHFENTGNDTAFNIYVLDTLPDEVDVRGLQIVAASATMNIALLNAGGHNIVRFDFPNINLLDSSHHNQCNGMVIFKIKTRPGLPGCRNILNRAGIFFDDNPVIMTNTVTNITTGPAPVAGIISGPDSICVGTIIALHDTVTGGVWSSSSSLASVSGGVVTAVSAGIDTIRYSVTSACSTTASALKVLTIIPATGVGVITGLSTVCTGATLTLSDSVSGGTWTSSSPSATVTGGIVTGVTTSVDTITYTVTNICGSVYATKIITVNPSPFAGTITGASTVCVASSIALVNPVVGGTWSCSGSAATVAGGSVTGITAGIDTIKYTITNSCGIASASKSITVNPLPATGTISGTSNVCVGASIILADTIPGGIWSTSVGTASVSGGTVSGISAGTDTVKYALTNSCGTRFAIKIITINPLPVAGIITGPSDFCVGTLATLVDISPGGVWSSSAGLSTVSGGTVMGIIAGTDTIKYTVTNSCGSAVTSKFITVNPLPSAGIITGSPGVCVGSLIILADGVTGGAWSTSSGKAAVTGGTVTGVISGTDTVKYTVTNSCGAAIATKAISIYPLPTIFALTGGGAYCADGVGVPVGLTGSETGVKYQLMLGPSPAGSTVSGTGDPLNFGMQAAVGTYTAYAVNVATSCADTMISTAAISIDSSVSVIIAASQALDKPDYTDTLHAIVTGASSPVYEWTINGYLVPGAISDTFVWKMFFDGDVVSCTVTDPNACSGAPVVSNTLVIHFKNVRVNQNVSGSTMILSPNPNKGTFNVTGSLRSFVDEPVSLKITNMIGQLVYAESFMTVNGKINKSIKLNTGLAKGVYILSIFSGSCSKNYQFVLEQ